VDAGQPQEGGPRVLDDLIAQVLLAQAAAEAGYQLDEAGLQARLDALASGLGSAQSLADWIAAHGYTEPGFRRLLARAASAAWMRDKIIADIPERAEQVHARQILLYNQDEANQVLAQVRAGTDFASLASEYDPVAGGDLGWFPRGYLTVPELDQAAFTLQEGQVSDIIQTRLGFHILQVIERDPAHPLEPGARLALQAAALQAWLDQRRSQSQIEVLLP
jgi:peptidyl-prolyl cis-trans isomerase C